MQRPSPFLNRSPTGRERVQRGVRDTSQNRRRLWIFEFLGRRFSENGSTRGVLIDDTAAIHNQRYLLDNMSCSRAIDDTAVNILQ